METIEKKIQITINGSVHVHGPRADYFKFLKGFCALIAGDLDEFYDKKAQYLIAQVLFENIKLYAMVQPNGRISALSGLTCYLNTKNFTEHPYMIMKRFRVEYRKSNTLVYFVDDCTVLKLSYNLALNIKESDNRSNLLTQKWEPFIIRIDDDIIEYIKLANEEYKKNKPFDLTQLSRFMAENMVKTLGKYKLYNAPPILPKLYAALEGNEKNIELNNVE